MAFKVIVLLPNLFLLFVIGYSLRVALSRHGAERLKRG
jgi:hypothetical protein